MSASNRRRTLARAAFALALAAVVMLPLAARVAWEGAAELAAADRAAEALDPDGEIEHLGRAARWRMPVLRHDDVAIDRLMAIGAAAEGEDTQRALAAYREARGALLGTRAFVVPRIDVFHRANERIATIMSEQERRYGTDLGQRGEAFAFHHALLERIPGPDPLRANLAALAFVGWLATAAAFLVRGIDARGRLVARAAVRFGTLNLILLAAWTMLLRFAS